MSEGGEGALGVRSNRRGFLTGSLKRATGALAALSIIGSGKPQESQAVEKEHEAPKWGEIANEGHEKDLTRGIFFFAGPEKPNSPYPTLDPVTDWDSDQNVEKIFDEIKEANVNVINLSWWGNNGETDKFAPTINTKEINNRVFKEAHDRNMLVAPVIEVSDEFEFFKDYPDDTQGFEDRIESLISDYGSNDNWLQMADKMGGKRHFIRLIETIHATPVDEKKFAETFDVVSEKIYQKTGKKVIFGIDPTPLPPNGPTFGPNSHELWKSDSVVITPYNIFSDGVNEDERIEKADQILKRWCDSGIPVILPLITGFDDTGTDRPNTQKFGNTDAWRGKIRSLFNKYKETIKGVSFDSYNTITEGGADVDTVELGDANYKFMQEILNDPKLNPNRHLNLTKQGVVVGLASDK